MGRVNGRRGGKEVRERQVEMMILREINKRVENNHQVVSLICGMERTEIQELTKQISRTSQKHKPERNRLSPRLCENCGGYRLGG